MQKSFDKSSLDRSGHARGRRFAMAIGAAAMSFSLAGTASAAVMVTTERDAGADTEPGIFVFDTIPTLSATDRGNQPLTTVTVVEGDVAGGSGPVGLLNNGTGQTSSDAPGESFFFANSPGDQSQPVKRVLMDLQSIVALAQVNTYSWHTGPRAPQVYDLYAAVGDEANFDPTPTSGEDGGDPTTVGYTLLGSVDTTVLGNGGQHGASFQDPDDGLVGNYRYLLFDVRSTSVVFGSFNNTFYGEWDVVAVPEPASLALLAAGGLVVLGGRRRGAPSIHGRAAD